MTLGEKIRQLRKVSGVSQEQLAEQMKVSRQSVSKWELDEMMPDVSKILLLSEFFGVSTDELLKGSPCPLEKEGTEAPSSTLHTVVQMNFAHHQILLGIITMLVGLLLWIAELLFLPVFGLIQKTQVNGQGFYLHFMDYIHVQPMPILFSLTGIIFLTGALIFGIGFKKKKALM